MRGFARLAPLLLSTVALAPPRTQVVIDIDDTIKSSGGVRLAGVPLGGSDTQYARGDTYPGVFQFVLELAAHREPSPLPLAVLTARAQELRALLELREGDPICVGFRSAGEASGVTFGVGRVLYGSVAEWLFSARKGWRKADNFEVLLGEAAPDTQFVFIGDTGELDEEAAERMLARHADRIAAVFLHAVSSDEPRPPDRTVAGRPLCYFRTYAGAAAQALTQNLMDRDAAMRVAGASERDLAGASEHSSKWRDLRADLDLLSAG